MSYKGICYTNVESLDREPQKSKGSPEKYKFCFAMNMLWFRDTEHFFTVKLPSFMGQVSLHICMGI